MQQGLRARSRFTTATLAALALVFAALPASAAAGEGGHIVTWSGPDVSQSPFVDPSAAPDGYYNEPPGVPPRPNALKVNVYLPPGYGSHPDRRYPLLMLLHGHGDAYDSWANPDNGDLLATAAGFGGVIVMPDGDHGWYTNWWNGGERSDPAWERYHLEQLLSVVRERLRIRQGRRWHAIAGLSMGGEGAIYYASQLPGYFGTAASFSGVLHSERPEYQQAFEAANGEDPVEIYGDPQAQSFYWAGHDPYALVANLADTRLYISVGDGVPNPNRQKEVSNYFGQVAEQELHQMANDFVPEARDAGADVTYVPHQGIHDWPYWRADLANAIDWGLFERSPASRTSWTYSTVAQRGRARALSYRFAAPPETLETLTRDGRSMSGAGSGTVTLQRGVGCGIEMTLPSTQTLPSCFGG